jgi:general secretion pathway protein G
MMMKRRSTRRAFTLIELLLVLVILAVLAAVVIPKLTSRVGDARRKATIGEISNLKMSLETFEIDNGRYPNSNEGLLALVERPSGLENTWRKLLDAVPMDKWGHEYQYQGPDSMGDGEFDILSAGDDGEFGTADDINKMTTN